MTVASALTQKWFDQNHTRRSTKPISALIAASKRARASLRKSCRGRGTASGWVGAGGGASAFASIMASPPGFSIATCGAASRRRRSRFSFAARSALYSKTARLAAPLLGRSAVAACPTFGRSSSASRAPRGSAAIAAIEPERGPKPNRWSASAASFGSRAISVVPPKSRRIRRYMQPLTFISPTFSIAVSPYRSAVEREVRRCMLRLHRPLGTSLSHPFGRRGRQAIGRPDRDSLRQWNTQVSKQQGKHHPVAHGDDEFHLLPGLGDVFRHLGPDRIRDGFAG